MTYSVHCTCSQVHEVLGSQADSLLNCPCGRTVSVPPLSALRQQVGQSAYEARIADMVQARVAAGELPIRGRCAICGTEANDTLDLYVECEQPVLKNSVAWYTIVLGAIFLSLQSLFLLLHWRAHDEPLSESGRDTVVRTPLCVDAKCGTRLRRAGQARLRQPLSSEPLYQQLLQEYPGARVVVPRD